VSDFTRRACFAQKELIGARWWQEHLAAEVSRRTSLKTISLVAVGLVGVGGIAKLIEVIASATKSDDVSVTKEAIELQRQSGWNVGGEETALAVDHPATLDMGGSTPGPMELEALAADLAPKQAALAPYYVPTLFQSVAHDALAGDKLRAAVGASHSSEMDRAQAQGAALASLFDGLPPETAVIVDLPGPLAVAFAAGMSDAFEPVFTFDNWPHPLGVVKPQNALAAALYYAPLFAAAARSRRTPAPPVVVLDATRLAPYTDAKEQFDNRYLAKLPTSANFAELGVKHLLYVCDGPTELDDLNDDFVAFAGAGLGPRRVDRGGFAPSSDPAEAPGPLGDASAGPAADASAPHGVSATYGTSRYYYGGNPSTHWWFWHTYSWYSPPPTRSARAPAISSTAPSYAPARRATIFSGGAGGAGGGVGRVRPGGFGRVTVTQSRSTGQITSTPYARSGSFGRAGSGGGGGTGG
jgi:hypothetical protein